MPNFDSLARIYHPLERITFAGKLEAARTFCIPLVSECQNALLIGDGDGRFSTELLNANRSVKILSIDISSRMLQVAKERAGNHANRLAIKNADALKFDYPVGAFDFIGLHFCLDCFEQSEVDDLLPKLAKSLKPNGLLAHTDFRSDTVWQKAIVRLLYFSFWLGAGLRANKLPIVKWTGEFSLESRRRSLGGLITSDLWRKA
ncbi:class I SAM-dependent methyltransferase [Pelagicoccus albus]|uniref:Class I SAM-dependent methyltransferase n=1 Tax=Pelagicoccus albus TaxID=415222 RepID=A0A7X1B5I5_9BACT|nr:class I SAM-dependent methyltransferase [Pelagicoccus albus]MBC2605997.1 class I SAM-dependent methyltransferase [Pelagicoccus albus]